MTCRLDTHGDFCEDKCQNCEEEIARRKAGEAGDTTKRGTLLTEEERQAVLDAKARRDARR